MKLQVQRKLSGFVTFVRFCPSASAAVDSVVRGVRATLVRAVHRRPDRATARTLWLFEHPRQPYESWLSILARLADGLGSIFNAPVPSG